MDLAPSPLERAATEALDRGDAAGAERLIREALTKYPNDYRCLVMLAHLVRERGEAMDSVAFAEQASRLRPNLVEAHYQLGLSMLQLGRSDIAAQAFEKAAKLRPEIADFHLGLGQSLEASGRVEEARKCFERAARLKPQDILSHVSLANRLLREDDLFGAKSHALAALSKDPHSLAANLAMAEIAMLGGEGDLADEHIRRAIRDEPKSGSAYAYLGLRLSHRGDREGAAAALLRSIELNPNQGFGYLALVQANRAIRSDRDFLVQLEAVHSRAKLPPHEMSCLSFALAISYESSGDCEKAMAAYDEANLRAYVARYGNRVFDGQAYSDHLKAIRDLFPSGNTDLATDSQVPIFIVGMIRSGTSLTEQILSSHPDVAGAGELSFWQRHADSSQLMAGILADPGRAHSLAKSYVGDLRRVSATSRYITDKLPSNYQRLGLLSELFPRAKVIHCVRHPVDNALSIYLTPNRHPSAGREAIVFNYRQYQEMMRYWRKVLPAVSVLDVQYECLVSNPEPEIRRILAFCELDWNEACLAPENNSKEVSTPSLWQVRQPINRNSVDRWKRFEPWLGAFRDLMS